LYGFGYAKGRKVKAGRPSIPGFGRCGRAPGGGGRSVGGGARLPGAPSPRGPSRITLVPHRTIPILDPRFVFDFFSPNSFSFMDFVYIPTFMDVFAVQFDTNNIIEQPIKTFSAIIFRAYRVHFFALKVALKGIDSRFKSTHSLWVIFC